MVVGEKCWVYLKKLLCVFTFFFSAQFSDIWKRCKARTTIYGIDESEFSFALLSIIQTWKQCSPGQDCVECVYKAFKLYWILIFVCGNGNKSFSNRCAGFMNLSWYRIFGSYMTTSCMYSRLTYLCLKPGLIVELKYTVPCMVQWRVARG
jgi:hypothetical protein